MLGRGGGLKLTYRRSERCQNKDPFNMQGTVSHLSLDCVKGHDDGRGIGVVLLQHRLLHTVV